MAVKVGVNGYGTIGKRVADAVAIQDDMTLVGVTKTKPDYEARMAVGRDYNLYVAIEDNIPRFEETGIPVEGGLSNLLDEAEIIVDATPGGIGAEYKLVYDKTGVKAVFQGGEEHTVTGFSFNALVNYDEAKNSGLRAGRIL